MSSSKIEKPITSREGASQAMERYSYLDSLLGQTAASKKKALLEVESRYAATLKDVSEELASLEARLTSWAAANRQEFGEKQSLELPFGWLKIRMGQRKLCLLYGWTWDKSLAKILEFGPASQWCEYVRRDPTLDVQRLLADTREVPGSETARLPVAMLRDVGLKVEQDESYSVKSKPQSVVVEVPCP